MAKKKKTDYSALIATADTGTSMAESKPLRHMKLQAFPGGGKSHFSLSFFDHEMKTAGLKPEEGLMTIIDCDLEGQRDLVARDDILSPELRPRLYRKVCRTPEEVNQMVLAFIDLHRQHAEQYPDGVRVMCMENEGAYYLACRDYYSIEVHGKSEAEQLLSRQAQAISEGKKTLPMFAEGQMHSYKVINKMFFQPYERLKVGAEIYKYHFISTVLLKSYTEGYGTANENRVVAAAGRADLTDPLFDWIIELTQQQRTVKGELKTRHISEIRKSRTCKPFRIENPTQEKFWNAVKKQS
ncbi:MAG: hypothetical protein CMA72_00895 [Euryarchaeota archaeon]|nr:hypothetical protein [Euryarchaeota archaeon]|tara:strand:+ start:1049 stop:1939 length:891 start_codon:yes stop_codon:yes gene_type:complete